MCVGGGGGGGSVGACGDAVSTRNDINEVCDTRGVRHARCATGAKSTKAALQRTQAGRAWGQRLRLLPLLLLPGVSRERLWNGLGQGRAGQIG